jgi:hypothetical protein
LKIPKGLIRIGKSKDRKHSGKTKENIIITYCLGGVIVSLFGPKDYKIVMLCFSAEHVALRSKYNTGWFRVNIMCQSGESCLHSELEIRKIAKLEVWSRTK